MKKVIVLILAIFLIFSINGFSQNQPCKTSLGVMAEQSPKGNKTGHKPRKSVHKKKIHKSGPKRHHQKKTGSGIEL
jgi:hypothetical protein